jgi:heme exporter protein D
MRAYLWFSIFVVVVVVVVVVASLVLQTEKLLNQILGGHKTKEGLKKKKKNVFEKFREAPQCGVFQHDVSRLRLFRDRREKKK